MLELPAWYFPTLAAVLGATIGSFANVAIHRIPTGVSVVSPPSACPRCGHQLSWFENIPVASYLALRGRCRSCRASISIRYPIIELAVAAFWAASALKFGPTLEMLGFASFWAVLMILSAIDLAHRRLPNRVLLPGSVIALGLFTAESVASARFDHLLDAAIGALAFGLPMLTVGLLVPKGMGMGDIKMSAYLGFHLGWLSLIHVAVGAFMGFLLGALIGVLLMAAGRKSRKDALPFGPFLAAGSVVAVFAGDPIIRLWLG